MPRELRKETSGLHAQLEARGMKLRGSGCADLPRCLFSVRQGPAAIQIGIDEKSDGGAELIGAGHRDDMEGIRGARRPSAPHAGSEALILSRVRAADKVAPADRPRSSERRNDVLRGSILS